MADIVAFPDDDCWYPPDLLERVAAFLVAHPGWDGLCGRSVDDAGAASAGRPDRDAGPMTLFNLWRRVASYVLFLRRSLVETTGAFDETLGVGASSPWRAGEDLDYVARSLRAGLSVYYDPGFTVFHEQRRERVAEPNPRQGYEYGGGFGRALRANGLPGWFGAYQCARPFLAAGASLVAGRPGRARFYWAVGRGRLRGWRSTSTPS